MFANAFQFFHQWVKTLVNKGENQNHYFMFIIIAANHSIS